MNEYLPNGALGIALAGLLAAFMAGMAANVSSFNTVFTYDIWQDYVRKHRPDGYYLNVGRVVTIAGVLIGIGTAFIAAGFSNIMNYIQSLFSFFNAPVFATFLFAMFWKRTTHGPASPDSSRDSSGPCRSSTSSGRISRTSIRVVTPLVRSTPRCSTSTEPSSLLSPTR